MVKNLVHINARDAGLRRSVVADLLGEISTVSSSNRVSATARSMQFWSSRTFPGQL